MLKINVFIDTSLNFGLVCLSVVEQRSLTDIKCSIFIEKVLSRPRLSILPTIKKQWHIVILNVIQKREHSFKFSRSVFLLC